MARRTRAFASIAGGAHLRHELCKPTSVPLAIFSALYAADRRNLGMLEVVWLKGLPSGSWRLVPLLWMRAFVLSSFWLNSGSLVSLRVIFIAHKVLSFSFLWLFQLAGSRLLVICVYVLGWATFSSKLTERHSTHFWKNAPWVLVLIVAINKNLS